MSMVNGLGSNIVNQLSAYQPKKHGTEKTENAKKPDSQIGVQKNKAASETHIQEGVELSEGAKKLLDELKEKYGNMDFFVSNYSSDEEAESIMSRGTKEYSVLIEPEILEQMAADEDVKNKYMGIIDESTGKLDEMKEQLKESGQEIDSIGMKIDAEGTVKFFAKIREQNEKYQKQVAADKEAAKAEEAKEAKRKERDEAMDKLREGQGTKTYGKKEAPYEKVTTIYADSVDELLEKIKNVDWSQIEATPIKGFGNKIDFTV
ncbi:DUF6033 family protein [Butyrivibrio sp. INlla16]|uniref:DUF6033 family protein n=1 Tax=Butyrivibrio sp. INlla16 TaxID=1520807 RepID=UPI00088B6289|nr:DUF6033 family protein [Butyrivibrio sp. INlla16]SDB30731.1 hypothetical protein SAMN02910263_01478 [Butyrivibrio sp. INlla16]